VPSREWSRRIQDILEAIARIQKTTDGMIFSDFERTEEIILQGILYNFIIIGESAVNIPSTIQSQYSQIPWRAMADMRNVMAHEYFQVNQRLVWNTIQNHFPPLVLLLEELLEEQVREN